MQDNIIASALLSHFKYTREHPCSYLDYVRAEHMFLSECCTIIRSYGGNVTDLKVAKDHITFEFQMLEEILTTHQITLSRKRRE